MMFDFCIVLCKLATVFTITSKALNKSCLTVSDYNFTEDLDGG